MPDEKKLHKLFEFIFYFQDRIIAPIHLKINWNTYRSKILQFLNTILTLRMVRLRHIQTRIGRGQEWLRFFSQFINAWKIKMSGSGFSFFLTLRIWNQFLHFIKFRHHIFYIITISYKKNSRIPSTRAGKIIQDPILNLPLIISQNPLKTDAYIKFVDLYVCMWLWNMHVLYHLFVLEYLAYTLPIQGQSLPSLRGSIRKLH